MFTFISHNPLIAKLQYGMKVCFSPLISMFFVTSWDISYGRPKKNEFWYVYMNEIVLADSSVFFGIDYIYFHLDLVHR